MIINKKHYSFLKKDAINRFDKYIQIDEVKSDYYNEHIDFNLLNCRIDYISANYKKIENEIKVSSYSVILDVYYKNSIVQCGYYKSFYNYNKSIDQFECVDEIFNLFIGDFQF